MKDSSAEASRADPGKIGPDAKRGQPERTQTSAAAGQLNTTAAVITSSNINAAVLRTMNNSFTCFKDSFPDII